MPAPLHLPLGRRQIGSEQMRQGRRIGNMEIAQRNHADIKLQGIDAAPKDALSLPTRQCFLDRQKQRRRERRYALRARQILCLQEILARQKEEILLEIEREEVSMAEMIERLRNMVRSAGEVNLRNFFERAQSRRELVVAFLSVLELVRMAEISLCQHETFGEITARATSPA